MEISSDKVLRHTQELFHPAGSGAKHVFRGEWTSARVFSGRLFSSTESLTVGWMNAPVCSFFISVALSSNAGTFYQQLQFLSVDFISPKILQVNEAGTIHIGTEKHAMGTESYICG